MELPIRSFRWLGEAGASALRPHADRGRAASRRSPSWTSWARATWPSRPSPTARLEIFADEGARVTYVSLQRCGRGRGAPHHRPAGGGARRADHHPLHRARRRPDAAPTCSAACRPRARTWTCSASTSPRATQHFDHETLQDHRGAARLEQPPLQGRAQRRGALGLPRADPRAQGRAAHRRLPDEPQPASSPTEARADSLPNLEIAADDVRCSHAATVGQLDAGGALLPALSRGIPQEEAMRLVIFGFFGEVLEQLEPAGPRSWCARSRRSSTR